MPHKPIVDYLDALMRKDWIEFNQLETDPQCRAWDEFINEFKVVLLKYREEGPLDYPELRKLLDSYREDMRDLPIRGKIYVKVGWIHLPVELADVLRDLEYEEMLAASDNDCNCDLLSSFRKPPELSALEHLGKLKDGYYFPKLYRCRKCGFKWTATDVHDSRGGTQYEKFDPADERSVEYLKKPD